MIQAAGVGAGDGQRLDPDPGGTDHLIDARRHLRAVGEAAHGPEARAFTGGLLDDVPHEEGPPEVDHRHGQEEHQGQDEGEFDDGAPARVVVA